MKTILSRLFPLIIVVVVGCESDIPTSTPEPVSEGSLQEQRNQSVSDDARTVEEAFFHTEARAEVIRNILPNKLNVGGERFRVKRNPTSLGGAFVYDPTVEFRGVQRYLVWWVPHDDLALLDAYPLNGPSQMVTPDLEFPAESGLLDHPTTADVVGYVFGDQPIEHSPMPTSHPSTRSYTIREYQMYRALIDTPMAVSEEEGIRRIAEANGITPVEAERIIRNVQTTIMSNGWAGFPKQEIRRASDWKGETY